MMPPLLTAMGDAMTASLDALADRVTGVRYAPGDDSRIAFEFDRQTYTCPDQWVILGFAPEAERRFCVKALLSGDTAPVHPAIQNNRQIT